MGRSSESKGLQEPDDFERALGEEVAVSAEYSLSLTLLTARAERGWTAEAVRRALGTLRAADLVTQPNERELLIALPNTAADTAQAVEERLRKAVPESVVRSTVRMPPETAGDLVDRAREVFPPDP